MSRQTIRILNTASNIAYLLAGFYVLWAVPIAGLDPVAAVSLAGLAFLSAGSARFHWTATKTDNILDRLGMYLTFAPVAVLGLRLLLPIAPAVQLGAVLLIVFVLVLMHDRLYSYGLLGIMAGGPLVILIVLEGAAGAVPLIVFGMAFICWLLDARRRRPGHDKWDGLHVPWHFGTAIGAGLLIASLVNLYLVYLGRI